MIDKGYLDEEEEEIAITCPEVFQRNLANFGRSEKHAPCPNVEHAPVPDPVLDPTDGDGRRSVNLTVGDFTDGELWKVPERPG